MKHLFFFNNKHEIIIIYNFIIIYIFVIYDIFILDATRSTNTAQTRAVYGIDIAVYNNNHIVSYSENSIVLWDSRHLEKPVVTLTQSKSVLKVQWCPTR